jgi:glyoxylase-like metal-dependent hydrolase (beta-lactamase superfamily II)
MNKTVTIVAPDITLYSELFGARRLNFYALTDGEVVTLLDAGVPGSVTSRIEAGELRGRITRLIVSHADADHLGDGAAIQSRFPGARIECHAADRDLVEHHARLVRLRYDQARPQWGFGYSPEVLEALLQACGPDFTCTGTLTDGQRLTIGQREWEVLHVPGHSDGHLALWNPVDGILILSDALLGYGPPLFAGGGASMPPTHQEVDTYLNTIQRLGDLPVRLALTGHWLPLDAAGFQQLVRDSRACVEADIATVLRACRSEPQTFDALITILNDQRRTWDDGDDVHYLYALSGYLKHLVQRGLLQEQEGRYRAA